MPSEATAIAPIAIERLAADFTDWQGLLHLIRRSFAYMDGVIDPPSSAHRLTPDLLHDKAREEIVFLAQSGGETVGCVFLAERSDHFYLGKLAIEPAFQGTGIGRRLVDAAEDFARSACKPVIELQVRVELVGNLAAFRRLGFGEIARTSHARFDRPTSITMRKELQ